MDVVQYAAGDADDEHLEIAPGAMANAAGDVNRHVFVQFDLLVTEAHLALAIQNVINLIRAFVVMQFRVRDLEMMHFRGRAIAFLDERPDLPAGLSPGPDFGHVPAEKWRRRIHGIHDTEPPRKGNLSLDGDLSAGHPVRRC